MLNITFPNQEKRKQILTLSTPIILGMLSINILDLVDTAMIGHLGNKALAATGFGSFIFFTLFSVLVGVSMAVQSVTARRFGEKQLDLCGSPLNTGLLFCTLYAVPISILTILLAPKIISLFSTDPEVIQMGTDYLQWRVVGLLAIGYSLTFRSFWNGIKEPHVYTTILIFTHVLNAALNWTFIFGQFGLPALGLKGAAIGSSLALWIAATVYAIVSYVKKGNEMSVLRIKPTSSIITSIFKISWPASVDQLSFAAFLLSLFWIFGQVGTEAAAVAHVVITCTLLLWLPGIGFGMASLTLVGESLGEKKIKKAKQWPWDVASISGPIILVAGLLLYPFSNWILSCFIHDPSTLTLGLFPLRLDLLTLWTACIGGVFVESLIGAGATRTVMLMKMLIRWIILIPGAYLIGIHLNYGLNGIWIYWVAINGIETLAFITTWQTERWAKINV